MSININVLKRTADAIRRIAPLPITRTSAPAADVVVTQPVACPRQGRAANALTTWRKKTLARLLAALLVGAAVSGAFWQPARAGDIIHIVQPGDDLFRIGLSYGVSWTAIMEANGLTSTTIYPGESLIIPVDAPAPATQAPVTAAPATPVAPTPTPVTPAVPPPTSLPPTDVTAIAPATATPVIPVPPPVAPAPAAPTAPATYVVQSGDTLFHISAEFGVPLAAIVAANNIDNTYLIYPGQTLVLPRISTVPSAGAASQKQIIVSISQQHLFAYDNRALTYSFVVSTGRPDSQTWTGTFSILDKIPSAYGADWNFWMPDWMGIYWSGDLEDGFHAAPILPNGQRLWDTSLGTPVSYGCIVLSAQDAQTLYDWAEIGTPVYIQP